MKALFIVNPAAGHGRGAKRWNAAHALAEKLWPGSDLRVTERPGHGRQLAREAALAGVELIVAVGGDGTLGEAADGYLSVPEDARRLSALATYPAGSGCDFARHARVPSDPDAWAAAMARAQRRRLDAALVVARAADGAPAGRHFLNVAALGLAGDVAVAVHKRGKPLGGALTYLLEGLLAVATARPRRVKLVVDGREEPPADYQLIAVCSTSTSGGGMKFAPDADLEDGKLDLLTVGPLSRLEMLKLMPKVYAGGHVGAPGVTLRRARRVEVFSEERLPLNVDGDLDGSAPAVFTVLPKALAFLL